MRVLEKYVVVTLRDIEDYNMAVDNVFVIEKEYLKQADEIDSHWYEYAEDDNYEFSFDIEKYLMANKIHSSKYDVLYTFLREHDVTSLSRLYEC